MTTHPRLTPDWSTACWPHPTSANAGDDTGWMSFVSPNRSLCGGSCSRKPGGTGITWSRPSMPIGLLTVSYRNRCPETCCRRSRCDNVNETSSPPRSWHWETTTSRTRTRTSCGWTSSMSSSRQSHGPSWLRRSAVLAVTTTSSTRSPPATTTPWPESSATPRRSTTPTSPSGSSCHCRSFRPGQHRSRNTSGPWPH